MILRLEVAGTSGREPSAPSEKIFRAAGGTIGRSPGNDLVLPDPYVSSRHARIIFSNGVFQLEDTSTNGVFINSPDNRLAHGKPCVLKTGDVILIDPYEIRVTISAEPGREAPQPFGSDPFGLPDLPLRGPAYPPSASIPEPAGAADVDPLSLLNLDPEPPKPAVPRAADLAGSSPLSEHYRPPVAVPHAMPTPAGGSMIPDDYDPLNSGAKMRPAFVPRSTPPPSPETPPRLATPPPAPPPAPPVVVRPRVGRAPAGPAHTDEPAVDLAAVLEGVGIDAAALSPEVARDFGRILRVVVEGLMDVLQSRQRIKDEFRMHMTSFKPTQNNPLKFSANVDDALHNLLVKRNAAYLEPVEAFEDAFDDVRNHQMAMLAGVRVAFEATLKAFDPDRLQQEFEKHGKGALLSVPAKFRYWDLYRDRFSDMVSDADACFRELFGQEFANAYEDQLERLKAQDRSRRPRS